EKVAQLAISKKSPSDCPPLGPAFTRWQRGSVTYPFQIAGVPSASLTLAPVLTEQYDHETIDASVNMERNFFAQGFGNLRWESWSKELPPGDDLAGRCPLITLGGYYYIEKP